MRAKQKVMPGGEYEMTLQEMADAEGVSRQAIRDVEQRALRKLRNSGLLDEFRAVITERDRWVMP